MKAIVKSIILIAVAALGITACQKEVQDSVSENGNMVSVTFVAGSPESKTTVNTSGDKPVFAWDENETFKVLEQTDALAEAASVTYEKVDGKANITAAFTANEGKSEYKYVTIYPASGYVSATGIGEAVLNLPAVQTMSEESYDPAADLMVSEIVTTTAQPAEAQMVGFNRVAAVVKMTLKNFEVEAGDKVKQVIFAADGKALAGTVAADLASPNDFVAGEGASSSVAVNTASAGDVYFTVLPTALEAGDVYTVTVITDKRLYIKKGAVQEGKTLEFKRGWVNRFSVDMKDVAASDKWVLVRDASTLKQGDVVTIAAKNYNYAVGKQGNNYPLASQTEVIKSGDYLYHPVASETTTVDNRIQHYTLLQRDNNRVAFDFYNGVDYEGDPSVGFVFATGSNYSPKLQDYCDSNTLFDVTITDGTATLEASEIEKTYKYWRYSHSTSASSRKFDCTTSAPTGNYQISIYKLEGAAGAIPVVAANVTVPDADDPVVIAEEGAQTAAPMEEVVFNYVGDWNVSASASENWLTVSYADGVLSYTAEANAGGVREAVVTITATREGSEPLSWTFNVLQKGAPQEITIAEFITKEKNENVTYKLTGKIVATATTSGTWKIEDEYGNVAQIKYLKMEDGSWASNALDLEVGDIMTVTTVVATTTKGSGGNSTYPSIYKGHYRLSATAGVAAEYTGGDVTIDVKTVVNGSVTAPTTVEAVMAECDYAAFSYDGGNTATVSFTSENTTSDAREAEVTFTYGMASVTVTVQQGVNPANKLGYELVTDASTLAVGDEVIIVAMKSEKALGCLASTASATGVSTIPAVDIEKTGNVIYDADKLGVMLLTLKAGLTENEFAFQFSHKGVDYYINAPSSGLKGRAASSGANNSTSYAITIDPETGDATVVSTYPRIIKFNSKTGTNFTAFKMDVEGASLDGNQICIYKKQTK